MKQPNAIKLCSIAVVAAMLFMAIGCAVIDWLLNYNP